MRSSRIALTALTAASLTCAAALVGGGPAQAAPSRLTDAPTSKTITAGKWRITALDLGTLGGTTITPTDVNSWGAIVGTSETADGKTYPFVGHPLVGVAPLPGAPEYFKPAKVTDGGLVAGREAVYSATAPTNAEVWAQGASTRPLGSDWSVATDAAENGTVLVSHVVRGGAGSNNGFEFQVDCLTYAATTAGAAPASVPAAADGVKPARCLGITRDGRTVISAQSSLPTAGNLIRTTNGASTVIPFRTFGDYSSEVSAVTEFGDVLGSVTSYVPDPTRPGERVYAEVPLRVVDDVWQKLPRPAGVDESFGITPVRDPHAGNIRHDLIGNVIDRGSAEPGYRGVVWRGGTRPEVLRAPGGLAAVLTAINGRGEVAGSSQLMAEDAEEGGTTPPHAMLWRDGSAIDLGAAVGAEQNTRAKWITESGVVVGTHEVSDGTAEFTRLVAWVVTPAS